MGRRIELECLVKLQTGCGHRVGQQWNPNFHLSGVAKQQKGSCQQ